jgi:hypothetical protein
MADYYVDVVNGASGNTGADANNAKQFISQASASAGNRIYLKRGQTHPIGAYKMFASNTVLSCYGEGSLPILQKTAGGDAWIYMQDVTNVLWENFKVDCNGFTGAGVTIRPTTSGSSGHTLRNIEVYGSTNHNGIYLEGGLTFPVTDVTVTNCISHGNSAHGFFCVNEVRGVTFESCLSYGNGTGADAHGFSTYSSTASPHVSGVTFKNCTAYGTLDHSGIEGQGFQFDNNSTNCSFVGCLSYSNQGAGFCFNVGSGHKMIGCVAYANEGPGMLCNGATGSVVANNTFSGNCRSTGYVAEVVFQVTSTGATINNNIIHGSDSLNPTGLSVDAGSASGSAAATNCIYGFTTAASGITPTGTITTNPAFVDGCRISTSSPCAGAGTKTVSMSDFNGKEFNNPPPIGAIMPSSARLTSARSVARRGAA